MEFGTRRTSKEMDAAIWGNSFIGGMELVMFIAGKLFRCTGLWKSYQAFCLETHKNCVFLVDTYDTLRIGVPAAIKVAREME